MWQDNSTRKIAWKRRPFMMSLLGGLILFPTLHSLSMGTPRCASAQQCLARGMFYYNNDDINDNASQHFNLVISRFSRSSKELEQARYYLASYYQRKYYIQKHRLRRDDRKMLELAAAKYGEFINNYKNGSQLLADAFFNQALAYLQLGDTKRAYDEMYNMREVRGRDGSVYIYEVVWSPRPEDVVDSYLPTESLGNFGMGLVQGSFSGQQQAGVPSSFEQKVLALRRWCQSQKSKSYK